MGVKAQMGFAERDALAAELRGAVLVDLEALERPHRERVVELRASGELMRAERKEALANEVRACIVTAQAAINRVLAVSVAPAAPEPDAEPPPPKGGMRLCVECARHRVTHRPSVRGPIHVCRQESPDPVDGSTVYRLCADERGDNGRCGSSGMFWRAKA